MRELDAVLVRFLAEAYESLPEVEKDAFAAILELPDPELHGLLLGRRAPEEPHVAKVIEAIRRCAGSAT